MYNNDEQWLLLEYFNYYKLIMDKHRTQSCTVTVKNYKIIHNKCIKKVVYSFVGMYVAQLQNPRRNKIKLNGLCDSRVI